MRLKALRLPFLAAALLGCGGGDEGPAKFSRPLPIPSVLTPTPVNGVDRYDLVAASGTANLLEGVTTPTYGYNGMGYLGPTIRLTRGRAAQITVRNELPAEPSAMGSMPGMVPGATSVHLHGLEVPDTADITPSGCCSALAPRSTATGAAFTPDQPSATLWYHPHPHMDTGRQVYMGLAGMMILDDPADTALNLPHAYGIDDLPVIVQDRRFKADGSLDYLSQPKDMEGMLGDRIIVNGAESPYAAVAATRVRLRLLNASNRRACLFAMSDGRSFQQIATDGGLLPAPATVAEIMVPPAGRAEIVVDFREDAGHQVYLVSRGFAMPGGEGEASERLREGAPFPILQFRIGASQASPAVPAILASLPSLDTSRVSVTRQFDLENGADDTINGQLFDMARTDAAVKAGAWEIWTATNYAKDLAHPWHVHGVQFRVLDRSTGPLTPNDSGWKDTVRVAPGETVRMLMHFDKQSGMYMFHCHILEHEDMGMMGQYEVKP